jgi:hypothetical protein
MRNREHDIDWHGHGLGVTTLDAVELYQRPMAMPMTIRKVGCEKNKMASGQEVIGWAGVIGRWNFSGALMLGQPAEQTLRRGGKSRGENA